MSPEADCHSVPISFRAYPRCGSQKVDFRSTRDPINCAADLRHPCHRDRENSTVMVSNLAPTTTENDLKKLFRDVRAYSKYKPSRSSG